MPNQFLQKHTTEVLALPGGKKVIVVPHDISAADGFQYLVKNNILSAPVYNATTKKYHGFLDMHDIVSFVVLEVWLCVIRVHFICPVRERSFMMCICFLSCVGGLG